MVFVRRLVLACLNFNILFRARHVPGVKNVLADSLSRLQVSKFRQLAPVGVQASPTAIPIPLLPHNCSGGATGRTGGGDSSPPFLTELNFLIRSNPVRRGGGGTVAVCHQIDWKTLFKLAANEILPTISNLAN